MAKIRNTRKIPIDHQTKEPILGKIWIVPTLAHNDHKMYVFWQEFPKFLGKSQQNTDVMHHQGAMLENLANFPHTHYSDKSALMGKPRFPTLIPYIMSTKHIYSARTSPPFGKC